MKTIVTIFLALIAAALTTLSLVQLGRIESPSNYFSNEASIAIGQRLLTDRVRSTADISISGSAIPNFHFKFNTSNGLWFGAEPWQDRADGPMVIDQLLRFALTTEVVDSLPATQDSLKNLGFSEDTLKVNLRDINGEGITSFSIGKSSSWQHQLEEPEDSFIPSIYIRLHQPGMSDHIYLCSDPSENLRSLFNNDLVAFRDPRAFALNINDLKEIRLKHGQSDIVLNREANNTEWKLIKPLELATDKAAVVDYLTNLSKLEAIALHEPSEVILPENARITEIGISNFSSDEEITLKIYQSPQTAASCYATISNRPIVLELPLIATETTSNYFTLLPKSINELRSRTILNWTAAQRADLRSIIIRSPQSYAEPVVITRKPKGHYTLLRQSKPDSEVDESTLATFLQQITTTPVKGFASDAATDFSPFGLEKPQILVDFLSFEGEPSQLRIGTVHGDEDDGTPVTNHFGNLRGAPVVWELSSEFVAKLPKRTWDWQPKTIWTLPVIDIVEFTAQQRGKAKLAVQYDFIADTFTGQLGGRDVSNRINANRAKFFMNECHQLSAFRRLSPQDPSALKALEEANFAISISVQEFDNEGNPAEIVTYELILAPATQSRNSAFYYAKANNQEGIFVIGSTTLKKLAALDIFDED